MKKTKIILIVNILILLTMFIGLEFFFSKEYKNQKRTFFKWCYPTNYFDYYNYNRGYKKSPILFLGCSYAYGEKLEKYETLPLKIQELTKRHCYNMAIPGTGLQHSFLQLLLEPQTHMLSEKPEYIIYTYMFHHPERFCNPFFYNLYRKQGYIPNQEYNFLYNSAIYRHFKDIEIERWLFDDIENEINLFYNMMNDMIKQSKILYPKSKFIVLIYADINHDLHKGIIGKNNENKGKVNKLFELMYSKEFKNKLEAMGYQVISTEELLGRKMNKKTDRIPRTKDPNYPHPSNEAWDEIAPLLAKKLNL